MTRALDIQCQGSILFTSDGETATGAMMEAERYEATQNDNRAFWAGPRLSWRVAVRRISFCFRRGLTQGAFLLPGYSPAVPDAGNVSAAPVRAVRVFLRPERQTHSLLEAPQKLATWLRWNRARSRHIESAGVTRRACKKPRPMRYREFPKSQRAFLLRCFLGGHSPTLKPYGQRDN